MAVAIAVVDVALIVLKRFPEDSFPSAAQAAAVEVGDVTRSSTGKIKAQRKVVAPGGVVALNVSGFSRAARVQERLNGRWVVRGRPVFRDGGTVRFRVRSSGRHASLRAMDADHTVTRTVRVRIDPVRLLAVGDINLSPAPLGSVAEGDGSSLWRSVGPKLKSADVAFGNLETSVSNRGSAVEKQFTFRSAPNTLAAMRKHSGMDVVNLANNHVGDYGRHATLDTIKHVKHHGIVPVGAGRNESEAHRHRIVERKGLKIAFVGFSNILPYDFAATDSRPGIAWATTESVRSAVQRASKAADVVIATFHWGAELATRPHDQQAILAREAILSGATAVIGAHPHVLQPTINVGRHKTIAYSLGNFVFPAHSPGTTNTGILELRLGAGRVTSRTFHPATIRGSTPLLHR